MKSKMPAHNGTGIMPAAFKAQVTQWAERIRVHPRQLRLQPMRRKWASCSTLGTVSFSTDILGQSLEFREYVIVHELLHLKVPNHGKLFKTLLRAYIPNYESIQPRKSM
jgi:predicted metal-dependent hydrolase